MKIIAWNCSMSFRTKAGLILSENPDLLVVPECESPQKLHFAPQVQLPANIVWYGDNPNKGLGVFSYGDYKLRLMNCHNPEFRYVLPIEVTNENIRFILFAVWMQKPLKGDQYVRQLWYALHYYQNLFVGEHVIIAGDFNSSSFFDKPSRIITHSALVKFLDGYGIESAYHHFHQQRHGAEKHATHFWQKKAYQPFHLDYCFASAAFFPKLKNVEIGKYENWIGYSDHKPVIVEFGIL